MDRRSDYRLISTTRVSGFTLIELLLGLTLGTTLLLATTALFSQLRESYRIQSEWNELYERGRHLVQVLSRELGRAGHPNRAHLAAAGIESSGRDDEILLRYWPGHDCAGAAVSTVRYYLDDGDLRCDGNGAAPPTPQTLTSGVDEIVFRYGVDSDQDGLIDRYRRGVQIEVDHGIKSITVAVLLRSGSPVRQQPDDSHYTLLGRRLGPFHDHYLRTPFQFTIHPENL